MAINSTPSASPAFEHRDDVRVVHRCRRHRFARRSAAGTPASPASAGASSFSATRRFSRSSYARNTTAMPPWPIRSSSRYPPISEPAGNQPRARGGGTSSLNWPPGLPSVTGHTAPPRAPTAIRDNGEGSRMAQPAVAAGHCPQARERSNHPRPPASGTSGTARISSRYAAIGESGACPGPGKQRSRGDVPIMFPITTEHHACHGGCRVASPVILLSGFREVACTVGPCVVTPDARGALRDSRQPLNRSPAALLTPPDARRRPATATDCCWLTK